LLGRDCFQRGDLLKRIHDSDEDQRYHADVVRRRKVINGIVRPQLSNFLEFLLKSGRKLDPHEELCGI